MPIRYDSILRAVQSTAWAIDPAKGEEILAFLALRADGNRLAREDVERVAAQNKRPQMQTTGATAVVPVYGVLAPRMNMLIDMSGGTSMEILGAQLQALADDPGIGTIVLDVDSPGGTTTGLPELCQAIQRIRASGTRVMAVANHMAASAAYWLACAADEIVMTPSAYVGSIGVFCVHADLSEAYAQEGIRHTVIKAGPHKAETLDIAPLAPDAQRAIQADVDDWYAQFVDAVARGRRVTPDAVRANFGQGRTVNAADAVAAGMVDRVDTLDGVLASLAPGRPQRTALRASASSSVTVARRLAAAATATDQHVVTRFPEQADLHLIAAPTAHGPGGRIRVPVRDEGTSHRVLAGYEEVERLAAARLVEPRAAQQRRQLVQFGRLLAFEHEWANTAPDEPDWGAVDKTALPREAFADRGTADQKSAWAYPHHWVQGGTTKDDSGVWTDGTLYVHTGGVNAAWSAANGGRSGEPASDAVLAHLEHHRRALGLDTADATDGADDSTSSSTSVAAGSNTSRATTGAAVASPISPPANPPAPVAMEHTVPDTHTVAPTNGATPASDPAAIQAAERQRASDLLALCREHDIDQAQASDMIVRGLTVPEASQEILRTKRSARKNATPVVSDVADRAAAKPFASLGEQLVAIVRASRSDGRVVDPRLMHIAAASGMSEGVPSDGGFLVQQDFATDILTRAYDTGEILSRVRRRPIGANSNGLKINAIDESSRADGQRLGGVQVFWSSEADTVAAKKPKLRKMELDLKKLIGVWYLTDELVDDTTALDAFAMDAFTEEVTFVTEDAIINGDGVGKPLGIMKSGALVVVNKEAAQAADTVVPQNIANMYTRMFSRSRKSMVWLIDQDVEAQIFLLALGNGFPLYLPPGGLSAQQYSTLIGKPILASEYGQALGNQGDIIAVDLDQYLLIDKGAPRQAQSLHVRFLNDEMTFRITYRVDGQPVWNKSLTPKSGGSNKSPYVALQAR